jgi:hypothetical protein
MKKALLTSKSFNKLNPKLFNLDKFLKHLFFSDLYKMVFYGNVKIYFLSEKK